MNTIDAYQINKNQTFNARVLKFKNQEKIPKVIVDAVYKSEAIDEFLKADKKKSLFQRFLNLFKSDEVLEISYYRDTAAHRDKIINPKDCYESHATLQFTFGRDGEQKRYCDITDYQVGTLHIKYGHGRVLKKDEDPFFDVPTEMVEDKIAKRLINLNDLDSKLRKTVDID